MRAGDAHHGRVACAIGMRRFVAATAVALAGAMLALVPATVARAATSQASDPVVTISTSCGGPQFCFTPATLTITDGDTVTWSDESGTEHVVTRCDPADCNGASGGSGTDSGFSAGDVPANGSYSHTFHGAGTYTYFCAIHGYAAMHGEIVVTAATPASTATTAAAPTTVQAAPGTTVAATTSPGPASTVASGAQLAQTGGSTSRALAVAIAALALGFAAAATRRRRSA